MASDQAAPAGPFRRALAAWDGSADAAAALRTATAIVAGRNCHVVALSLLPADSCREASNDHLAGPALQGRMEAAFETARAAIARTSAARIDLHTAEGRHVAGSLCDYASEHGFDVLVIGRRGHGSLISRKIGHIAEAVVRSCSVPVLLVSAR